MMERLTGIILLNKMFRQTIIFFLAVVFLQEVSARDYPVQFSKRIENNHVKCRLENVQPDGSIKPLSNLDGKTDIENLFFEDFNAPVEYFFRWESKYGPEEPLGFRIVKDSSGRHYLLEVKSIPNFKEVNNKLEEEFPLLLMSLKGLDSIADSTVRRYGKHNMAMYAKRRKEAPKRYRVETRTFRIGDRFAEALYNKFVNWIDRFDSKAEGPSVGYWATFRCVVDNEVWTLSLDDEFTADAVALSDLCREIIADAVAGRLDEAKYLERLGD